MFTVKDKPWSGVGIISGPIQTSNLGLGVKKK